MVTRKRLAERGVTLTPEAERRRKPDAPAPARRSSSGISVSQPKRDIQGKTALDRQIAANKAKQSGKFSLKQKIQQGAGVIGANFQRIKDTATAPKSFDIFALKKKQEAAFAETGRPHSGLGAIGLINPAKVIGGLEAILKTTTKLPITSAIKVGKAGAINTKTGGIVKRFIDKIFTTSKTITTVNPVTGKSSTIISTSKSAAKPLAIAGVTTLALAWIVEKSLGGKVFGQFLGKEEAAQAVGIAVWMAQSADDYEGYLAAREIQKDILSPQNVSKLGELIPYKNVLDGINTYAEAALAAGLITDKIMADKELGEPDDEKWARIRQEQAAQDKAATDYYNAERKKMFDWEQEARAAARAATRAEDKKQMEANAKFWAREADKQRQKEAEDRQAIADFWLEYRKMLQEIADNNRPSNLNFGLL